jgi:hypothetical protein
MSDEQSKLPVGTLVGAAFSGWGSSPMFPSTVTVGTASIKLHADGTFSGDGAAFVAAIAEAKRDHTGTVMPILWLLANAIRSGGETHE